ncbi:MAG: UDP-N-acetylmuramoyl-L-alanine--D-glutamate ligase [Rhizobiales bacterium]|nr:UDP-N-acetylmuramoyl-L-alanine--D-glutamate ligase [Hyphomicrobiales bacterium]
MIIATGFSNRNVAVFGLGKSGLATVRSLEAGGAKVFAWDDSVAKRDEAKQAGVKLSDCDQWNWAEMAALVLSPGVPFTHPEPHRTVKAAQAANVEVIGDVELFQRALTASGTGARMVAITGTNGKSTTTALIGHMVRRCGGHAEVGGNIGKPVLELEAPKPSTVYVIEVSSYQIDLAPSLAPQIGVLLNITPDHIDRHGTIEGYAAVKARLFARQGAKDTSIIGIDDAYSTDICTSICAGRQSRLVPISVGKALGRGIYVIDGVLYDSTGSQAQKVDEINDFKTLAGAHNWQNAAAAYATGRALGFAREKILSSFESFPGLAHRMEIVADRNGVRFVNDSKATNADAASKALATYDNIYWIIGGKAKEGGIESLKSFFPRIRKAYLIGDASDDFAATLEGHVPFEACGTLERATAAATRDAENDAQSGEALRVVLLSPACASFDQFKSFEERGDLFRSLVVKLVANRGGAAA